MGEAELIDAVTKGGPWAAVVGGIFLLWRRDSNAYITMLTGVVKENTAAIAKLIEKLDRVLDERR